MPGTQQPAITINASGLMWYQNDTSSTNWQHAVDTCENDTTTGGYWASTSHVDDNNDASNAVYVYFGRAAGYFAPDGTSYDFHDVHGAGA